MNSRLLAAALFLAAAPAAAQPDTTVYQLSDVTTPPRASNVAELGAALETLYPQHLRAASTGGVVTVRMVVGRDGRIIDARPTHATDTAFVAPTLEAVKLLRFVPAEVGGRPVAVWMDLPIEWTVDAPSAVSGPDEDGVYTLSDVDVMPRPTNMQQFTDRLASLYPPELVESRVTGVVQVGFVVNEQGVPRDIRIEQSTNSALDDATREAIGFLRFTPARLNGRRVPVRVSLPIDWNFR